MPNGHVTHAEKNGIHVLRYFGRVDYMCAPAIKRFADGMLSQVPLGGVVFDLNEAENLDSTNLGLLARIADRVRDLSGRRSIILSSRDDINSVLASMGFDQIFDIVPDGERVAGDVEEDISPAAVGEEELRKTMLEAHRRLVDLSDTGRQQFQDVVACLESS